MSAGAEGKLPFIFVPEYARRALRSGMAVIGACV
jgi:hypothetical protein